MTKRATQGGESGSAGTRQRTAGGPGGPSACNCASGRTHTRVRSGQEAVRFLCSSSMWPLEPVRRLSGKQRKK